MAVHFEAYQKIMSALREQQVTLVAVSKTKPVEDIQQLYDAGHRDFGENYVQELLDKEAVLPKDIRWHFIGHLQTNKVKYIAPFVHLVHGVDSVKLLSEMDKQAQKNNRILPCLLQVHIAAEETKFGFDEQELVNLPDLSQFKHLAVQGVMGMASFSSNLPLVRNEFKHLKQLYDKMLAGGYRFNTLSMGMSGDYGIAVEEGSNMVRIGSLLFGERNYTS